jgi:hypothetical protein
LAFWSKRPVIQLFVGLLEPGATLRADEMTAALVALLADPASFVEMKILCFFEASASADYLKLQSICAQRDIELEEDK